MEAEAELSGCRQAQAEASEQLEDLAAQRLVNYELEEHECQEARATLSELQQEYTATKLICFQLEEQDAISAKMVEEETHCLQMAEDKANTYELELLEKGTEHAVQPKPRPPAQPKLRPPAHLLSAAAAAAMTASSSRDTQQQQGRLLRSPPMGPDRKQQEDVDDRVVDQHYMYHRRGIYGNTGDPLRYTSDGKVCCRWCNGGYSTGCTFEACSVGWGQWDQPASELRDSGPRSLGLAWSVYDRPFIKQWSKIARPGRFIHGRPCSKHPLRSCILCFAR